MLISFFVIFLIACLYLTVKDPFWGLIFYIFSVFLRFQDYLPGLSETTIGFYIISFTFLVAFFRGKFNEVAIDKKLLCLLFFIVIINAVPLIQNTYANTFQRFFARGMLSFLIITLVVNKKEVKWFILCFFFILVFLSIMLFHSYYVGDNYYFYWHHERPYAKGLLENPNAIVFWLNLGLILSVFLSTTTKKYLYKAVYFLCSFFFVFGVMLCNSRSGILQLIAGIVLLFLLVPKKNKIITFLLIVVVMSVVAQRAGSGFWRRMETISGQAAYSQMEASARGRLYYWKRGIEIIKTYPLLGVGLGRITRHNVQFRRDGTAEGRSMHNGFIEVMAENGVVGSFFWFFLFFLSIKDLFSYRLLRNRVQSLYLINGTKAFICFLGPYVVSNFFGSYQYNIFIFVYFGMSSAIKNIVMKLQSSENMDHSVN